MRVLLLSTTLGYQLRAFDAAAERLGIELIFATDRCHQLDDPWRDRAIPVRFHQEPQSVAAVVREARVRRFHGVLAMGDRPVVLAARIAEALGLPGHPPDAAAASVNKREQRRRLAAARLRVPWHFALPARSAAHTAARDPRLRFPCVLKPLGLSGSRGVIRANSVQEFAAAFERIQRLLARVDVRAARSGLDDAVLVEGFIPGREYAVEGVLTDGDFQIFAIFDKPDPLDGPFFEETIYVTPSRLDAGAQAALLANVMVAAEAIGLVHGPIHAECRTGPEGTFVLEVAARPIGGLCAGAVRFAGGRTLEDVLLRHAAGQDISGEIQEAQASAVMMIPIPARGRLRRVVGDADAREVPGVVDVRITAKPDQVIEPLPEAASYLGFLFSRAAEPQDAEDAVREAHRRLSFEIEPALTVVSG